MTTEPRSQRPKFTRVSVYNDPSGLLSFWYATEWQLQATHTPLPAISLFPDPGDPGTFVAITIQDLEAPLEAEERPIIITGVREGIARLDESNLESLIELTGEGRWGLEWKCTFLLDGQRCRRRARLFFSDRYQYAVVLQGSSEKRYAYWQGMLEWTMLTVATAPFYLQAWAKTAGTDGQHQENRDLTQHVLS